VPPRTTAAWGTGQLWPISADASRSCLLLANRWLTYLPGAGVPLTTPRLYSAAASDDLKCAALYVHSLFPRAKMVGIGFSLGANVLTRYLGEEGEQSLLSSGCALACVRRVNVTPSR
jgi:hypothetical protein